MNLLEIIQDIFCSTVYIYFVLKACNRVVVTRPRGYPLAAPGRTGLVVISTLWIPSRPLQTLLQEVEHSVQEDDIPLLATRFR